MSFIDYSPSRKQFIKILTVSLYWLACFLIIFATTKPVMLIGTQELPLYFLWDLHSYSFSFNNLYPFAPRFFLVFILSVLTALRAESFDISIKFLSILTTVVIVDLFFYIFAYPFRTNSAVTGQGFVLLIAATISINAGLILSLVYNYMNWKYPSIIQVDSDNLYPLSE